MADGETCSSRWPFLNNKIILKMADGVKRARLDGDKEIYLAELLGVNIADAHTTVTEVLRSSGMPTWRIATNIPMMTWIVLNQESKL